jgi:hypothetical protein
MLKPTAAFRMKKHLKWMFHSEQDPHRRGELRRQVVQAQLASEIKPREKKHKNEPDLETT